MAFRKLLIDKYHIQVNKTSQHTVLFIVNIGIHPQTSEYLIEVLREVAERLLHAPAKQVIEPQTNAIAMPQMRRYHPAFSAQSSVDFLVDVRQAYYAANQSEQTDYLSLDSNIMLQAQQGQTWVSAAFVTPYPPGFPMLVPGQIIDYDFLLYFSGLTIKEIHGYQAESGLKIFQASYLDRISPQGV